MNIINKAEIKKQDIDLKLKKVFVLSRNNDTANVEKRKPKGTTSACMVKIS
jgi:hypothetical protein